MLHKIHLQRATDTAVLQGNEVVVLLCHYSTLLYEFGIDIDFSNIIDNHREAYASTIGQYSIQKCCLATAQIARQQQDGNVIALQHIERRYRNNS